MYSLLILKDPLHGAERWYTGLRLGLAQRKQEGVDLKLFLFGDAVGCAKRGQHAPRGFNHLGRMLTEFSSRDIPVGTWDKCITHTC